MDRYQPDGCRDDRKRLTIDELPDQLGRITEISVPKKMMLLMENAATWNGAHLLLVEKTHKAIPVYNFDRNRERGQRPRGCSYADSTIEQELTPYTFIKATKKLIQGGEPQKKDYTICYKYDGNNNEQGIAGLFDLGNLRLEIIPQGTGEYGVQQHVGPKYSGGVGVFFGGLALIKPKREVLAAGGMAYLYDVGYSNSEKLDEVGLITSKSVIKKILASPEYCSPFNGDINLIGLWKDENEPEDFKPEGDWISPMGWGKPDRKTNSLIYAIGAVRPEIYGYGRDSVKV